MNFDELLQKAKETAKTAVDLAGKKTEKVVEYSKLKIEQTKLNGELARLYEELGQATYRAMKCEEECAETMDILCDEIELILNDLEDLEQLISEKKNQKVCPDCGAKVSKDSKFCSKCGAPVEEEEEEAEEPEDEEEPCGCEEAEDVEEGKEAEEAPAEEPEKPEE